MSDPSRPRARLERLLEAARKIADPAQKLGARARDVLCGSTGLSPENVEFALHHCLETHPSEREIDALIRSTPSAQSAHVLLSSNVFIAAHRAVAIGLAASEVVFVRASRREPEMAELLFEATGGLFELVPDLSPRSGDRLWAYGSDETMIEVASTLPPGVALHAHGTGFGVAVIDRSAGDAAIPTLLARLAEDIAVFDQRGCLSPRVLFALGDGAFARELAEELSRALAEVEMRMPRGRLMAHEAAEITRYRETASFLGDVLEAGSGYVSVGETEQWSLPPSGRNLHVLATDDVLRQLARLRPMLTTCAFAVAEATESAVRRALPGARLCAFGHMQRPPFDGPVDRRDS